MFTKGQGVHADLETAVQWLTKAANGGSEAAKRNLALLQSARSKSNESNASNGAKGTHVDRVDSTGMLVRFEPVPGGIGWAKVSAKSLPKGQLNGFSSGGLLDQVKDSVLAQMGWDFAQH
jgi:TPR repeat protein